MSESFTVLLGGITVGVTKKDGAALDVFVKQLAIKDYPKYLVAQDNESDMVALATDLTPENQAALTIEAHEKLVAKVEELNMDFFSRWVARHLARQERLIPGLSAKRMEAVAKSPLPTS